MLKTIIEASQNFCVHQICATPTLHDSIHTNKVFIAYIDITLPSNQKHRAYIASSKEFMQRVSKLFLEEDESDEETLIDMTLETANLIIGSAKVIAEEENENPFTIGLPNFEKYDTFDFDFDEVKVFNIDNEHLTIAIKELN